MSIWGFLGAAITLTLLPGPDILFVITQSILQGKKAGIIFAAGLCTGLIFHVVAVSLGVSVLLKESPWAFSLLKVAGAAYLLYLGVKAFVNRRKAALRFETQNIQINKLYCKGILMNLLNPKVVLFFLAFFPQFIEVSSGNPARQMWILGSIFILQALLIFSFVAVVADGLSVRMMRYSKAAFWMNIIETIVYIVLGVSVLLM